MRLLITQFSPASYSSSLLGSDILLTTLFSSNFSQCSSLNDRDQVSHPYKTKNIASDSFIK
jgi:hypothetical protein